MPQSQVTAEALEVLHSGEVTSARVSAEALEALHTGGTPNALVSSEALEILRSISTSRVSATALEVLRSVTIAPPSGQPAYHLVCFGATTSNNGVYNGGWSLSGTIATASLVAESQMATKLRETGGIFSNMGFLVYVNGCSTPSTMQFRKNGLPGYQNISVPAGATGWFEDSINTDTAYAGETVGVRVVSGAQAAINNFAYRSLRCKFVPDEARKIVWSVRSTSSGDTQYYQSVSGTANYHADMFSTGTSPMSAGTSGWLSVNGKFGSAPGVISHFCVDMSQNAVTAGSVVCNLMTEIGGTPVATGLGVSIPNGATGEFVDATNTYTFSGQKTNLTPRFEFTGVTMTDWFSAYGFSWVFTGDDGRHDFNGRGSGGNTTGSTYHQLWNIASGTVENEMQDQAVFDFVWSNMRIYLDGAPTGGGTAKSRINNVDGQQSISLVGTGWLEDTTHTDLVKKGDRFNIHINSTNTRRVEAWSSTIREQPRVDDASFFIIG